jgi:hypothetical protein
MNFIFGIAGMIGMAIVAMLYFIPAIIAREKADFKLIFLLNLFLGWTIIGWIWALIWSFEKEKEPLSFYKPGYPGYTTENALKLRALQNQFDAGVITKTDYDNTLRNILSNNPY